MEHLAAALEAAQKANKTLEANAQRIHERLNDLVARMRAERTGSSSSAGRPDRTITELRTFDGRLTALDLETGECRMSIAPDGAIPGVISDPLLNTPKNVYVTAFALRQPLRVTAKAALDENGWMRRLYISDAELPQPPESR